MRYTTAFKKRLEQKGLKVSAVNRSEGGTVTVELEGTATKEQLAMVEKEKKDFKPPTAEEIAEAEDRAEFARSKTLIEATIEAMRDPRNVTAKQTMEDAERRHVEKKKKQRKDKNPDEKRTDSSSSNRKRV